MVRVGFGSENQITDHFLTPHVDYTNSDDVTFG